MSQPTTPPRIDVHAHFIPDFYREAALAAGLTKPDGMPEWPAWSEQEALATMDRLGIGAAVLSISSPGVRLGQATAAEARHLARRVNEAGAALVRAYPTRFGLFASLPLPDVAGALAEVSYAYDTLRTDGIILQTNYQGTYLGDPALDPLLAELHARRAVVFLHPTAPPADVVPLVGLDYPAPLLEFMFETTRTVTHLLLQRVPQRYPGIRWIVPHAGAALPVLLDRVAGQAHGMHLDPQATAELFATLRTFYFDLAGMPLPRTLPALRTLADPARLLYGTDYCFEPEALVQTWQTKLDPDLKAASDWEAVMRGNARALFPRLVDK